MVLVQSPLKRDYIVSLLDGKTLDSISFLLVKREGMNMYFAHDGNDEAAEQAAKKAIRNSEFGPALFFRVTHE